MRWRGWSSPVPGMTTRTAVSRVPLSSKSDWTTLVEIFFCFATLARSAGGGDNCQPGSRASMAERHAGGGCGCACAAVAAAMESSGIAAITSTRFIRHQSVCANPGESGQRAPSLDSHQAVIREHIKNERQCRLRVDAHAEVEPAVLVFQERARYRHVASVGDEGDWNRPNKRISRTRRSRHVCALSAGGKDEDGVLDALGPS